MKHIAVKDDAVVVVFTPTEFKKFCSWLHMVHSAGEALEKFLYIPQWLEKKLFGLNIEEADKIFEGVKRF